MDWIAAKTAEPSQPGWRVASKEVLRLSGQVQSLNRALKIMNALASHPDGLGLSGVARETGLPSSTAHRLLTTLQSESYVRFATRRGLWRIGAQAWRVGQSYAGAGGLAGTARARLNRLARDSGGDGALWAVDGIELIPVVAPGGSAGTMAAAAALAFLSGQRRDAAMTMARQLPRLRAGREVDGLEAELAQIARRGYAQEDEAIAEGAASAVAAAIRDDAGAVSAVIALSIATGDRRRIAAAGEAVAAAAREITAETGGARAT